jgi:hypothetical protein
MKLSRYFHNDWHNKWFKCMLDNEDKYADNDYESFWELLCQSENVTMNVIRNNLDQPWMWDCMEYIATDEFIDDCMEFFEETRNMNEESKRECYNRIFAEYIENDNEYEMDEIDTSYDETITIEDVKETLNDEDWDLSADLDYGENCKIDLVINNPELPWDWQAVGYNKNLTLSIIAKHPNLPWSWYSLIDAKFLIDKQHFIQTQTKNATILQMHLHFDKHTDQVISPIEYVIFDSYLAKQILQY